MIPIDNCVFYEPLFLASDAFMKGIAKLNQLELTFFGEKINNRTIRVHIQFQAVFVEILLFCFSELVKRHFLIDKEEVISELHGKLSDPIHGNHCPECVDEKYARFPISGEHFWSEFF